ncbi:MULTISPECIES: molecular chaperone HtpG [Sphaerochaeta]|jgi:molecular chaperone HtpG|uniref:Chaperone protein HtpG n=3 Tax=Sphaerochaeta TaxID=399320 RepID=A0ABY4D9U1_9SPIR|nr:MULTISPECIES: molecular chaperone HtpG [Sphaerochaeta]MDD2394525.1 molecular chaperone HtpG [Sphaerochaeta sp.]MDD3424414.1 molecular chaperone HtpG [Sphaerochaeta sp.]MDD3456661.1 molecular chaperone HtpG [Sphaerochaeta sp.]MDX9985150.1 molecular chaperone HtpG [Sphaerochaeta sp.]UOM51053.1 molecular chaperone HtpG [Sphaerochaeta associata]
MEQKKFKTEVSELLQLIIHSLYSHKEIFLRELVSNSSDALDKLKYLNLTDEKLKGLSFDPRIDISFTEEGDKRNLTISDNGLGMSHDDLSDNLGTIASSGTKKFLASLTEEQKKDSNLIGQFGVGFYSAFMVADKVEVISLKAGEEQAWKWSSTGKGSYTLEEAVRDGHGTTITLHLNEEGNEYANRWQIEQLVKKYSDHIAYPIFLSYDQTTYDDKKKDKEGNAVKKVEHKVEQINSSSALWRRSKSELTDEQYKEFYKQSSYDSEDPLFYVHTRAEGATEYTTLFFIPSKAPFDLYHADYRPGVKLYVKRVYITDDDKELLPTYLRFVRGVIDSEDLPLNVSREILQQNRVMSAIRNASVKKLLGEFQKISEQNPELYTKFIEQFNRPLKEGLYSDYANRDALLELVRFKSSSQDGYVSLASYKQRMPADQKSIYYIAGGKESTLKASPLLESYRKKGFEVLIMSDDIDDIVVGSIGTYKEMPLKAINKSGAVDDLKEEKDTEKTKEAKSLVKKIKKALGDKVKDVVVSSRLVESPAVVVVDENDPSVQMQQILKSMGQGDFEDVKPILEINVDDPMIMKIDASDDTQYIEDLCSVLLDQALLAEGVMPKDPVAFTKKLHSLLSK